MERLRCFIWAPPPAVAEAALKQLKISTLKRQKSTHVFVCPRLMICEWMRHFHKAVDFHIEIPAGFCCWPESLYEPLILSICLLYINSPPWRLRCTPKVFGMVRKVHRVLKEENMDPGNILRKF